MLFFVLKNTVVPAPSISTGFATLRANVGYLCPQCTKTENCSLIIYFLLNNIKYGMIGLHEVGKKSNSYLVTEIGKIKSRIHSLK